MWRDPAYLLDILSATRRVLEYTTGLSWEEFAKNCLVQDATLRQLEIIGEAARKVSLEFRSAHPELPWQEMIGMRNRLIHEYSRVDLTAIWSTVTDDLPVLLRSVEPLVPPDE
jgi:uncharacterized protein with HEPN domain